MGRKFCLFTRKEVIESTECTSNQLQSYERADLIVPKRIEVTGRPTVLYTKRQLLQVKAVKNLREQMSLQTIKKIVSFLDAHNINSSLYDKQIIAIDDEVFWVDVDWTDFAERLPKALKIISRRRKEVGQYTLIVTPPLVNIVSEILKSAEKSKVIDFESFKARFEAAA
jgi:DNA-binding transcriptional MerR regulator